jgi:hypothetical protein
MSCVFNFNIDDDHESKEQKGNIHRARYLTGEDFGIIITMSGFRMTTCKKTEDSDGTIAYVISTFNSYELHHKFNNAIRFVLSPRMYACCPPEYRLGFTDPKCSWALTSQETGTSENCSYLFRIGPIRPIENVYDDFLYIHGMSHEQFWEHVKEIGGIPSSDYYIVSKHKFNLI